MDSEILSCGDASELSGLTAMETPADSMELGHTMDGCHAMDGCHDWRSM